MRVWSKLARLPKRHAWAIGFLLLYAVLVSIKSEPWTAGNVVLFIFLVALEVVDLIYCIRADGDRQ